MLRLRGIRAALCLTVLLCGCAASLPGRTPRTDAAPVVLAPQPLRGVGLAIHHVSMASGVYALAERLRGPGEPPGPEEAREASTSAGPPQRGGMTVTWYGHSTVLLQLGKTMILTDPVLAGAVSLASPLPVRYGWPQLHLDQLRGIDAVVLSHGDFDHLHAPSLRMLAGRFPEAAIVLPDGLAHLEADAGFRRIHALPLNGSARIGAVTITGLPAIHATRRNLLGIPDGTAFSWELRDPSHRVLFIGDSGYAAVFAEIGRRRGPYDLVLVPIGASEPRHLVGDMHMTPEEAVRLADDVRAKAAIGIHWGTFALSPEPRGEPSRRFLRAGATRNARTLSLGETARFP